MQCIFFYFHHSYFKIVVKTNKQKIFFPSIRSICQQRARHDSKKIDIKLPFACHGSAMCSISLHIAVTLQLSNTEIRGMRKKVTPHNLPFAF